LSILIQNGLIFDPAAGFENPAEMDILIQNGNITRVEKRLQVEQASTLRVFDAKDKLIIPGLINSHLHSHDHFDRGRFECLPLELWILFIRPWIGAKPLTTKEIYLRTMIGAIEMVRTGTTFCMDDVNLAPFNTPENVDAVMQAYRDIGISSFVSASVFDKPAYQTVPFVKDFIPESIRLEMDRSSSFGVEQWERFLRECLKLWGDSSPKVRFVLGPSAPQRCTDQLLLRIKELGLEFDRVIVTHVLETKVQRVSGERFYGKSILRHLKDLGFLGPRVALVHCVWVSDDDLNLIAESRASIIHCPVSNLKLGSGIAPLESMLAKKIPVGLGTDNTSCNDSQNMFEVMKFAGLLPKINHGKFERWPTALDIFHLATSNGAKIAGKEGEMGTLKIGNRADLVILNLKGPSFLPVGELQRNLVYSENGRSVHTVIAGGEIILENGKLTRVNEADLHEEILEVAARLRKDHRSVFEKAQEIFPYFQKAYIKCHEEFSAMKFERPH
jgi:cytosine/adenosine deaminase-related metal-dependent hydrolase